jgi:phosphate transport system substrate-binding protein
MKNKFILALSIAVILSLLTGCIGQKATDETTTRGNIKIAVDESYKLLMDTEVFTFQSLYPDAKINAIITNEFDAVNLLLQDSVRLIVISRQLTKAEDDQLKSKQFIARNTKIAFDALAFIVNKDNPDSNLRFDQIRDIFSGKISKWSQINKNSKLEGINVVFDNAKSGNPRYVKEKFKIADNFPSNCFAVKSNEEVVNYIKNNKNGLGIISVNWISDSQDTISNKFLQQIIVAGISEEGDIEGYGPFMKPYQGYIAEGSYPFTRDVYTICREPYAGLGTGFASFVAGDQGQRIVRRSGLVPAQIPIRLVEIKR